jgi:dihydroceramidase
MQFERQREEFYQVVPYIAEFWNTVSNLPFILIGLYRLKNGTSLGLLYVLYALAGVCSGIHHATTPKWTIIIDWIPIASTIVIVLHYGMWRFLSMNSVGKLSIALTALVLDHVWTPLPVPWGHVLWHLLAAWSIDAAYQELDSMCKNI